MLVWFDISKPIGEGGFIAVSSKTSIATAELSLGARRRWQKDLHTSLWIGNRHFYIS